MLPKTHRWRLKIDGLSQLERAISLVLGCHVTEVWTFNDAKDF